MITQLGGGIFRQDASHSLGFQVTFDACSFDLILEGRVQQRGITEGRDLFDVFQIAVAVLVELVFQERHGKCHIGLLERARPSRDDGKEQREQHQQADGDRHDTIEFETTLGGVAAFGTRVLLQQGRAARVCEGGCGVGDIAHSYCSRYLRTM